MSLFFKKKRSKSIPLRAKKHNLGSSETNRKRIRRIPKLSKQSEGVVPRNDFGMFEFEKGLPKTISEWKRSRMSQSFNELEASVHEEVVLFGDFEREYPDDHFEYEKGLTRSLRLLEHKFDDSPFYDYVSKPELSYELLAHGITGPLGVILSFSSIVDILRSFIYISKEFYDSSLLHLSQKRSIAIRDLKIIFNPRCYISESLLMKILPQFEGSFSTRRKVGNLSLLEFCIKKNYNEVFNALLDSTPWYIVTQEELELASRFCRDKMVLRLLRDCRKSYTICPSIFKCFLYQKSLEGLQHLQLLQSQQRINHRKIEEEEEVEGEEEEEEEEEDVIISLCPEDEVYFHPSRFPKKNFLNATRGRNRKRKTNRSGNNNTKHKFMKLTRFFYADSFLYEKYFVFGGERESIILRYFNDHFLRYDVVFEKNRILFYSRYLNHEALKYLLHFPLVRSNNNNNKKEEEEEDEDEDDADDDEIRIIHTNDEEVRIFSGDHKKLELHEENENYDTGEELHLKRFEEEKESSSQRKISSYSQQQQQQNRKNYQKYSFDESLRFIKRLLFLNVRIIDSVKIQIIKWILSLDETQGNDHFLDILSLTKNSLILFLFLRSQSEKRKRMKNLTTKKVSSVTATNLKGKQKGEIQESMSVVEEESGDEEEENTEDYDDEDEEDDGDECENDDSNQRNFVSNEAIYSIIDFNKLSIEEKWRMISEIETKEDIENILHNSSNVYSENISKNTRGIREFLADPSILILPITKKNNRLFRLLMNEKVKVVPSIHNEIISTLINYSIVYKNDYTFHNLIERIPKFEIDSSVVLTAFQNQENVEVIDYLIRKCLISLSGNKLYESYYQDEDDDNNSKTTNRRPNSMKIMKKKKKKGKGLIRRVICSTYVPQKYLVQRMERYGNQLFEEIIRHRTFRRVMIPVFLTNKYFPGFELKSFKFIERHHFELIKSDSYFFKEVCVFDINNSQPMFLLGNNNNNNSNSNNNKKKKIKKKKKGDDDQDDDYSVIERNKRMLWNNNNLSANINPKKCRNSYNDRIVGMMNPKNFGVMMELVYHLSQERKKKILNQLFTTKVWRRQFLLCVIFENRIQVRKNLLIMFPSLRRKLKIECFHCGTKIRVFNTHNRNNRVVRCQNKGCCTKLKIIRSLKVKEVIKGIRDLEKLFCGDCYIRRRINNRNLMICRRCNEFIDHDD